MKKTGFIFDGRIFFLVPALLFVACKTGGESLENKPDPGQEYYQKAMKQFYRLEGETLDPGYGDTRFDDVIDLLKKVPFGSKRWKDAQKQLDIIQKAREKAELDKKEVKNTIKALTGGTGNVQHGSGLNPVSKSKSNDNFGPAPSGIDFQLQEARTRVDNVTKQLNLKRKEIMQYCGPGFLKGQGVKTRKTKLYQCESRSHYYQELLKSLKKEREHLRVLEHRVPREQQ
ncbi:MAG: hypothetical protein GXP49_02140 [Deltaproteobacteria bacterium]|nr:hypothetical protein [Deltaproteobacteria bacterium]